MGLHKGFRSVDVPKKPKHTTAPGIPRVSPSMLTQSKFWVTHTGELVSLHMQQGNDVTTIDMDATCAAHVAQSLRLHAHRTGRMAGGGITISGILSDAGVDYKYGLDKD